MESIELMAPAGSFEALQAAINAGADSVYFGVEKLNMRAKGAINFKVADLPDIVQLCREHKVKTYLTLNSVMYDEDLKDAKEICDAAKASGITAVIASDLSVIQYGKEIGLEVHISTQCSVSNIDAVKFFSEYADVIVLARELTIEQIKHICDEIEKQEIRGPSGNIIRIEVFAHGALCVSIAGRCFMSLHTYNASANRGACLQNCRRGYRVIDDETGKELVIDNKYVMSPKDLCTIGFIDRMLDSGARVLKIEGRGRSADYVNTVVRCYREAIDSYKEGTYTKEKIEAWKEDLGKVFNRGFWHGGYYFSKDLEEIWCGSYGSQATEIKIYVGKVINYFAEPKIMYILLEAESISKGDKIIITGPTTGVVEGEVSSINSENEKSIDIAEKGMAVTVPFGEKVRKNDKIYLIKRR